MRKGVCCELGEEVIDMDRREYQSQWEEGENTLLQSTQDDYTA